MLTAAVEEDATAADGLPECMKQKSVPGKALFVAVFTARANGVPARKQRRNARASLNAFQ
jgi:hypothetical protein